MVIIIEISKHVSFSLPILRTVDKSESGSKMLVSSMPDAASQIKPGLAYALFSNNKGEFKSVKQGKIKSVEGHQAGTVLTL
jgi:hypothetical protein